MATPITIDIETFAKWVGLIAGFLTSVGLIIRFLSRYIREDRKESAETAADISVYKKLQDEISRLEKVITTQQTHIETGENKVDALRDLEMDGATDLGALTMIITHMPCHKCANPSDSIAQLQDVVERMNRRRIEKTKIIKGDAIVIKGQVKDLVPIEASFPPLPPQPQNPNATLYSTKEGGLR
jgi:hypothetical protein